MSGPGGLSADEVADLEAFGADEETIEAKRAELGKRAEFIVHPENWDTLQLFIGCVTQWRVSAFGSPTGLDYTALKATAEMMGFNAGQHFNSIQIMERAALDEIAKRSNK